MLLINSRRAVQSAGLLLTVVPSSFMAAFGLLSSRFDYPAILRRPAGEVLLRFYHDANLLLPLWWLMLCAALLFIPTGVLAARALRLRGNVLLLAVSAGSLAGLVQALGLARWTFVVPLLANEYVHTAATDPKRQTIVLIFEVFHSYLGAGIGEWMGYLFTATWTVLISLALWQHKRFAALVGFFAAAGIAAGLLEPFSIAGAGAVNAVAYVLWSVWMIGLGITLLRSVRR